MTMYQTLLYKFLIRSTGSYPPRQFNPMDTLTLFFKQLLDRIQAKSSIGSHSSGPKRPSLSEIDNGKKS